MLQRADRLEANREERGPSASLPLQDNANGRHRLDRDAYGTTRSRRPRRSKAGARPGRPLIAHRPTIAKEGGTLFADEKYAWSNFPCSVPPTALSGLVTTLCRHLYDY